tara:strand:- start:7659 stop:7847 length:189 start_codon:yes stop_codon:yes gene_type:complete
LSKKTNQYTDAIFSVVSEYRELLKDAPKKKAPKIAARPTSDIDPVDSALRKLGLSPEELRRP